MSGAILIEIIIALGVFSMTLAGVMELSAATAAAPQDIAAEREAGVRVADALATASATLSQTWGSEVSVADTVTDDTSSMRAWYASPCLALLRAEARYALSYGRRGSVMRATLATNPEELAARGGDCGADEPLTDPPLAATALPRLPAPSTAIDALGGFAYVGLADPPYLAIIDLRAALPTLEVPASFSLSAMPDALDAVEWHAGGERHVALYMTLATTTGQLAVLDATNPAAPQLVSTQDFAGVDPAGSYPQGWRVRYYGGRLYATARETSGPELHTFDASDPLHPRELGGGVEIGSTINDFDLVDRIEAGVRRRYLFAATDRAPGEVEVFNATDPANTGAATELLADRVDLPGAQNGESVALAGSRLYAGRANAGGPELYVFDASHPAAGLPLLDSYEVGASVTALRVAEPFVFLETAKSGGSVALWNLVDETATQRALAAPPAGMPAQGIDLDGMLLIAAGKTDGSAYALAPQ
jgi:hypothetical protein